MKIDHESESAPVAAPAFRIRLIGKDGGVKMDRSSPVDTLTLFSLIDAMPMRQAEMSRRR